MDNDYDFYTNMYENQASIVKIDENFLKSTECNNDDITDFLGDLQLEKLEFIDDTSNCYSQILCDATNINVQDSALFKSILEFLQFKEDDSASTEVTRNSEIITVPVNKEQNSISHNFDIATTSDQSVVQPVEIEYVDCSKISEEEYLTDTLNLSIEKDFDIEMSIGAEEVTLKEHRHSQSQTNVVSKVRLPCDECSRTFSNWGYLKQHKNFVHIDTKYICGQCHKKFLTQKKLTEHQLRHIEIGKRFSCPKCVKKFVANQSLQRHIASVHDHDQLKYRCKFCAKGFIRKDHLLTHERTHTHPRNRRYYQ